MKSVKIKPFKAIERKFDIRKTEVAEINRTFNELLREIERIKSYIKVAKSYNNYKRVHQLESILKDKQEFYTKLIELNQEEFEIEEIEEKELWQ